MNFLEDTSQSPVESENSLWVEKYRPKDLSDYIGNDALKKRAADWIANNDIPHLLLYGKAGTGKTTLGKLITKQIQCDHLYINASDENNVDTVRTKIKSFASSMGFSDLKVVLLDECDFLTGNAQAALRNLMEQFSMTTRFILTCNYHEKIIDPIVSRCQTFNIIPPNRKDVAVHLAKLLAKERIECQPDDVVLLVNKGYPDIRKVINNAQQNSINGVLEIVQSDLIESDYKLKLLEILKGASKDKKVAWKECRQLIADEQVNDFTDVYKFLFDTVDEYAPGKSASIVIMLDQQTYHDSLVVDKEITFASTIAQIVQSI
jgi:DNA polymerase III delta prime subunit